MACGTDKKVDSTSDAATVMNKVSIHIQQVIQKLQAGNWTPEQLAGNAPGSAIVRVDSSGCVQCYVHLSDMSPNGVAILKNLLARTETINMELQVVQGWIHNSEILRVAQLSFVTAITPPEYGKTL